MIKKFYRKYLSNKKIFRILANFVYYKNLYNLNLLDFLKNKSLLFFILEIKREEMPLPFFVQIEPTTKCNLKCEFCTRKLLPLERLNKDLNINLVKKIIKENPNLKVVKIQGLGEPTLTRDFENILKLLKKHDCYLITITNGTTLISDQVREILLKYFDEITISIDSINKNNFEKIRIGAKFEKVIEGLKQLVQENSKYNKKIKVNYVFSHLNYKEIPDAIDFFENLGVEVGFVEVQNWKIPGEKHFLKEHEFVMNTRIKRNEIINYLKSKLPKDKYEKYFYFLEKSYFLKGNCDWGFYKCFITFDGLITPCCIRMEDKYSIGDLKQKKFNEIWNGKKFRKFRKAHIKKLWLPICEYCPD